MCSMCRLALPADAFGPDSRRRGGLNHRCRKCDAARGRAAYAAALGRPVRTVGVPSYNLAHRQLRKARGSASTHPCAGCGGTAHHWSYDHTDPAPLYGLTGGKRRDQVCAYSLDHARYRPMCRSCHTKEDQGDRLRREIDVLRVALWLAMLR